MTPLSKKKDEVLFYQFHKIAPNYDYTLINRDGSKVRCKVVYFPIRSNYDGTKVYDPPRALIQIGTNDFREVPFVYIQK